MRWLVLFICLVGNAWAAEVRLAWNANTEPDLAGYKIHYGTASGNYTTTIDVGNITTCTVPGLADGTRYYFAATAYDTSANDSCYSNEVNWQSREPPVFIGATAIRASKLQQESIMADSALYTAATAIYDFENNANDTKGAKDLTVTGTAGYSTTDNPQGTYWMGESLTKLDGTVVNSRERVAFTSLASSVDIRLSGLDLTVSRGKAIQDRVFTVEAVYDSDYETDIPLNDACIFQVENLVGVPVSG